MLPAETPEGEFRAFIPREPDVEYDVSFARFEDAGEDGADIPLAVVYHNAFNPNFEIDVIDMRLHEPPYRLARAYASRRARRTDASRGTASSPGSASRSAPPTATPRTRRFCRGRGGWASRASPCTGTMWRSATGRTA